MIPPGPLLHLSLWRVGDFRHRMPHARDNADRLREFRSLWPALPGNAHPWRFRTSPSINAPAPPGQDLA